MPTLLSRGDAEGSLPDSAEAGSSTGGSPTHGPALGSSAVPRSAAAVAIAIGALSALVASRPLKDNSFLTHLATGRLILADGVPTENPFLFTGTDFPVPSWWWSVLLAVAEDLGGASGIRLLTALLAGAVGAVLVRLARTATTPDSGVDGAEDGLLARVLPALLAMVCVLHFLSGRPHLGGFLLLALAVLVWNEEWSPWWLVPIFVAWVNVHGSWLYGVAVLVMFAAARALDDRRIRPRDLWAGAAASGGVVLGGALYPTPFQIVLLPTRQFGDPIEREALSVYQEWARVPFDHPIFWALLVLSLVALWGAVQQRRWATTAVVLALFVMGVSSSRLVPVAAISLVPFAARALRGAGSLRLPTPRTAKVVMAVGGAVALAAAMHSVSGSGYVLAPYPEEAVDWLDDRGLVATADLRVVSHDYVGNYLEWRYGVDAHAYVDDRPDAATLLDYRTLKLLDDGWEDAFDRADPDVVLWETDRPLTRALTADDGWVRAVELDQFTVFCRSGLAVRCR